MIGEAIEGRGNKAWKYYKAIAPSFREQLSEVHRLEPYVYAQMIGGKEAGRHGEAKNSWLTGTAAWNFVAVSQWILGVRPAFDGLVVDPKLPDEIMEFSVERKFRGAFYVIRVKKTAKDACRVASATLDGQKLVPHADGSVLVPVAGPRPAEASYHTVEVVLSK